MNRHFIFDTNAYRTIINGKNLPQLRPTANEMKKGEEKLNCESLMSVVVSMELLKHCIQDDPLSFDCFKALTLQFFHTQSGVLGEPNNNISFIPPLDTLLTKFFFNKNSQFYQQYLRIIEIVHTCTQNLNDDDVLKEANDIQLIANQLVFERTEFRDNLEAYLKELNGGVINWSFFEKNRKLKAEILKSIENGTVKNRLAISLLKRAHSLLDLEFPQQSLEDKFRDFEFFFEPLLNLNQEIIQSLANGAISWSNPTHKRWNTLNDIQIIGAACYNSYIEKGKDSQTIIVTDDEAIHKACVNTYMENNVWRLNKYFSFVY